MKALQIPIGSNCVFVYNNSMEKTPSRPSKSQPSARSKMMDYLAHRDHSEEELRKKLKQKDFTEQEIDQAIEYGKEKGWIPSSSESSQALAEKTAETLSRKGKGIHYINDYLEKHGMPPVQPNNEEELEKAKALAHNKFSNIEEMDRDEKAKVGRFLISRGFDMEIVRKVIYE